ncbi:MAG: hypothetical protein FJY54_06695 [Betaproteobacteria bacterium]|nr:hypothetical protein [Betaproteobacteria bacterium]
MLYAIIFVSGAAVLALELLASRIMTPYFGVSLYIWTGILSITLVALALGYWAGGRFAGFRSGASVERLTQLFALMPAAAAFAIVAACLAYPYLFAGLAAMDLVLGAFAACLILLFVPLVAVSAMNPLLVAILLARGAGRGGDAGAGRVFFVSTIGSVAGVLVTAFGLIPNFSNFSATLTVALMLALLSLAAAVRAPASLGARRKLGLAAGGATLAAALMLWQADAYVGRMWPANHGGRTWRVEARINSLFGTVKILRSDPDPVTGGFVRIYFQDGLIQNTVASDGRSLSYYTYALEALAHAYRPQIEHALVLGLGAGIVPMRFAERGVPVDAVEIDPASLAAAQRYFGFDPSRVRVELADARTQLRRCARRYDVIIVDLFHGDGIPDYLVTRDFFNDLRRCLTADGIAVFNTFADLALPDAYAHLLATVRAELPHIVLYRPEWPGSAHVNSFLVASVRPLPPARPVALDHVVPQHAATLAAMLARPQALHRGLLEHGEIVTDARNRGVHDIAETQANYRRAMVESLPRAFLLN